MRYTLSTLISISILLFSSSCSNNSNRILEPTNEEIEVIKPLGNKIAKSLVTELKKELKSAIKDGGFEKAVNVCNLRAAPITKIIANETNRKVVIKRTSNKYRNPVNSPDKFEKKALLYFEEISNSGETLPEYHIQKIKSENSTIFNYYKPIKMANNCLICHGDADQIKPDILKTISKLYPVDKAIGYKENDFRGLIRITIWD